MSTIRNDLFARWRPEWEQAKFGQQGIERAKATLGRVFEAHDRMTAERNKIASDQNLSAVGRREQTRGYIRKHTGAELRRARQTIKEARADLESWRARLRPVPAVDKSDAASAVVRSEMRALLRGMNQSERAALLLDYNADPRLIDSVLEAPDFMSGVTPDVRAAMVQRAIESAQPEQLEAIEHTAEAIDLLDAAVSVVTHDAKAAGEFETDDLA